MAQGSLRASVENKLCARSFLCCAMPIDSDEDTSFGDLAEANERKDAYLGVLRAGELETADALRAWSLRRKTLEKDKPVNAWDEEVEQAHQNALRTLREPATLREAPTRRISTVVDARPSRISSRPPLSKEDVQTFFGKDAWENTPENVIYFLLHVSCLIAFFNPQEYGGQKRNVKLAGYQKLYILVVPPAGLLAAVTHEHKTNTHTRHC